MGMFGLLPRPLGSIFRKLTHLTCNSRHPPRTQMEEPPPWGWRTRTWQSRQLILRIGRHADAAGLQACGERATLLQELRPILRPLVADVRKGLTAREDVGHSADSGTRAPSQCANVRPPPVVGGEAAPSETGSPPPAPAGTRRRRASVRRPPRTRRRLEPPHPRRSIRSSQQAPQTCDPPAGRRDGAASRRQRRSPPDATRLQVTPFRVEVLKVLTQTVDAVVALPRLPLPPIPPARKLTRQIRHLAVLQCREFGLRRLHEPDGQPFAVELQRRADGNDPRAEPFRLNGVVLLQRGGHLVLREAQRPLHAFVRDAVRRDRVAPGLPMAKIVRSRSQPAARATFANSGCSDCV